MTSQPLSELDQAFERSFPTPDAARSIYEEQEFHRAVEAYRFFYPTVSLEALFSGLRAARSEESALFLLAAGPRHGALTASSDTPYAIGALDLERTGPLVVELPPGMFLGAINDHHQRWILDLGLTGPDAGAGGKYLVLPPGSTEEIPEGYHLGASATYQLLLLIRALPVDGDFTRALHALRQVRVHPLDEPLAVLPFVDISDQDLDATPARWEDNLEYWGRLHEVIDREPLLEELRPMYGLLAVLGIERNRPFVPTSRQRRILEAAARAGIDELRVEGFDSQRMDRLVWNDRQWEWVGLVPGDPNFETDGFLDLEARDRWFFQTTVASPALFQRQAGAGLLCFASSRDQDGAHLDGSAFYKLVLPQPVPAQLFWSVTIYDAKTRSQVRTEQNKAVLSPLRDRLELSPSGTLELLFGPQAPAGDARNWLQTPAEDGFFLYLRVYGAEPACLDGRWRPHDLMRIDRTTTPPPAPQHPSRLPAPAAAPVLRLAPEPATARPAPVQRQPLARAATSGPLAPAAGTESARAPQRSRLELQLARLSADRTLLAVLVAALGLIASGFVIFQLFQELHSARVLNDASAGTLNFGVTLVCLGVLLLLLGSGQHVWWLRELSALSRQHPAGLAPGAPRTPNPGASPVPPALTLISAALLLSIGVAALLSMLAGVGPFH
jgi:uncharacterized membrane protein YidH (DUF202 family)